MKAIAIQRSRRLQARNFLDRDRPPTSKLTTSAAIAQHIALSLCIGAAAACWSVKAAVSFDDSAVAIHVVRPGPIAQGVIWARLVAAFRHHVQEPVDPEKLLAAAAEC